MNKAIVIEADSYSDLEKVNVTVKLLAETASTYVFVLE